jgi:hypothetical protein
MVANYEERIAVIENRVGIFCSIKRWICRDLQVSPLFNRDYRN